jgi:hypothetical protein
MLPIGDVPKSNTARPKINIALLHHMLGSHDAMLRNLGTRSAFLSWHDPPLWWASPDNKSCGVNVQWPME